MRYDLNQRPRWLFGAVQYPKAVARRPTRRHSQEATAAVGKVKLSSLQHLALTHLASQPGWCDAIEIGASHQAIGHFLANGLADRLPADRVHPPRYRINAAGIAALESWTPHQS
jgi:hypothetical protein